MAEWLTQRPFRQNIRPGWVGDFLSREHVLAGGIKLDPAGAFVFSDAVAATVDSPGADAGDTAVPVVALTEGIPSGVILNFGAVGPVTVTVNDADVNATETSITVLALSGDIPAGAILEFSGSGSGFAKLSAPAEAGDTTLTVDALPQDIDNGATATFRGGTKQARLTAAAEAGDVELTVDELQFSLAEGDVAYYFDPSDTQRVPAGTLVGCTFAELEGGANDGLLWGPAADADDIVRILAYDVLDLAKNNDADVLRPGTLIYVNHFPGWSDVSSTLKAKVRAQYEVSTGAPGQEVAAA